MKQTSDITRKLADAQEQHAQRTNQPAFNTPKTLYRIYTQFLPSVDVVSFVGRYFAGATVFYGLGLDARTQESSEQAIVIEIVSSLPDSLQRIINLAGDLRVAGEQISVLVTVQDVRTFEITTDTYDTRPRVFERTTDSPTINLKSRAQAHRFSGI